ncbi:MAG: hypothetical protein GW886_13945 [Rhodobacterales bacterium]|nr:hypothetical protein [Rhodobacterales bacterium]
MGGARAIGRLAVATALWLLPAVLMADMDTKPILVIRAPDTTIAFAHTDIARANLDDDGEGAQTLTLMLQPHAVSAFSSFTEAMTEQVVVVSLCGSVLWKPRVMTPIYGGMIPLPHLSPLRGAAVMAVLAEGAPCPAVGLPE